MIFLSTYLSIPLKLPFFCPFLLFQQIYNFIFFFRFVLLFVCEKSSIPFFGWECSVPLLPCSFSCFVNLYWASTLLAILNVTLFCIMLNQKREKINNVLLWSKLSLRKLLRALYIRFRLKNLLINIWVFELTDWINLTHLSFSVKQLS